MNSVVLDASAVLALVQDEPGSEVVKAALAGAIISTVNSSEVLQKLIDRGLSYKVAAIQLDALNLVIRDFTQHHAVSAAVLRSSTKAAGLSFSDRACLAVALNEGLPVLTADRAWSKVDLGVEIRLIR